MVEGFDFFGRHLGEGFGAAVGDENGVPAEAAVADWVLGNGAGGFAAEDFDLVSVLAESVDSDDGGGAISEWVEQAADLF